VDRRTDRAFGVSAIVACAVVPAVLLGVVKVDAAFSSGRELQTQIKPDLEDFPGAPKFFPKVKPGTFPTALPTGPAKPAPAPTAPTKSPTPVKPGTAGPVHGYTRWTAIFRDIKSFENIEGTMQKEEVQLKPRFGLTGRDEVVKVKGVKLRYTDTGRRTVIKGRVRATSTDKGETFTKETLSAAELAKLKDKYDPQSIVRAVKRLPGIKVTQDKKKNTHYEAVLSSGAAISMLPPELRLKLLALIPPTLGVQVSLWVDPLGRPGYFDAFLGAPLLNANNIRIWFFNYK